MKVNSIEEAQDLSSIKVDELIGFLQTFEISFNERSEKKNKGISFVSYTEEDGIQGGKVENWVEDISRLGRKVNNSLKNLDKKWRPVIQT